MVVGPDEVRVRGIHFVDFECLVCHASFYLFLVGRSLRYNSALRLLVQVNLGWLRNLSLKFGHKFSWVLEIGPLLFQMLDEGQTRRNESVASKVTCQSTLNVIFFVVVVAKARGFSFFVCPFTFATTVPVQVGTQCRGRQKYFDVWVVVASESLI